MILDDTDRLYRLLPAYYRQLDPDAGYPLRALLRTIAEQANALVEDIGQSYEDLFIETCRPWVAPYLGDLVGYDVTFDPAAATASAAISPRADVANTIAFRRRKGTLGVLESLTAAVARWPAVAVELAERVGRFFPIREAVAAPLWSPFNPARSGLASVRNRPALVRRGTPFDRSAHMADVRRVSSARTPGRADIHGVGVFVYRLLAAPVVRGTAHAVDADKGWYTFDPLGHDVPLLNRPEATTGDDPLRVPGPIALDALPVRVDSEYPPLQPHTEMTDLFGRLYGVTGSFAVSVPLVEPVGRSASTAEAAIKWELVAAGKIIRADLSKWKMEPPADVAAIDPRSGRLILGAGLAARARRGGAQVTYHHAMADTIGAGGLPHGVDDLDIVDADRFAGPTTPDDPDEFISWLLKRVEVWLSNDPDVKHPELTVEVATSQTIAVPAVDVAAREIVIPPRRTLRVRAAKLPQRDPYFDPDRERGGDAGFRPVFRPIRGNGHLTFRLGVGEKDHLGGRLILEGLTFADTVLTVTGDPLVSSPNPERAAELALRRVTLIPPLPPGVVPNAHRPAPTHPPQGASTEAAARLVVRDLPARVSIRESIVGPVWIDRGSRPGVPVHLDVSDSIWDAGCPDRVALTGPNDCHAAANLSVHASTIRGRLRPHSLHAENAILLGLVHVARRQQGEMRYCYYRTDGDPNHDRTPARVRCQPESARRAATDCNLPLPVADAPVFTSTAFWRPGYFQLAAGTPAFILSGAEDESELGAYHRLQQFRRAARLRARFGEFAPTGFDIELIFVT